MSAKTSMIGVDVGGTFTDVVAIRDGAVRVAKVPSVPANPHLAVLDGARSLGVTDAAVFNHASTKGLNAILTRRLPKIGFLTTDGHRDMLDAGRAWRPFDGQTDAGWRRPFGDAARPLVPRYLRRGVRERILASGAVLIEFDEADARAQIELLKRCRVEGVAICLLNSYVDPAHERRLRSLAREILGDLPISVSSDISPRAKEYGRASTTVIDVLMKLLYRNYAAALDQGLRELGFTGALNFADCAAGLLPWQDALQQPHRIIFAGPAAGTASCIRLGAALREDHLICCDVGGTSTDVSLITRGKPFINDTVELEYDLLVNALSTEIASVGAGGGSIVSVSPSGDIVVGPGSAGADPGPACYQRGGTLPTLTDACLLMGVLDPHTFAGGAMPLAPAAAEQAFHQLDCPLPFGQRITFAYRIAINNIAEEIANVAIRHGADPRDFSLVAYGAAGPMLLAGALDLLHLRSVIVPPHPGLFSALGLLGTDLVYADSRSRYLMLVPESAPLIAEIFATMERRLRDQVQVEPGRVRVSRSFDGRLLGQSWETPFVEIPAGPIDADRIAEMTAQFHAEYRRRNGQSFPDIPVQAVTYRVQLVVAADKFAFQPIAPGAQPALPIGHRELRYFDDRGPLRAAVYDRAALAPGASITGPAIIQEPLCTTVVHPGQRAGIGTYGEIRIERIAAHESGRPA